MEAAADLNRARNKVKLGLLLCGFLFVFTETLLSPFYPQFFARVFGVEDIAVTGYYMAVCRLTVMICAPLWGLAAKRFDPIALLIFSQAGCAVFTVALSLVNSVEQFFAMSVVLLVFKSSYLLFYTVLISLQQQQNQEPVSQAVGVVHLILHSAIIGSTLLSSQVISSADPLSLFVFAAILDVVQVAVCVAIFVARRRRSDLIPANNAVAEEGESDEAEPTTAAEKPGLGQWGVLLLTVFCFHMAINLVRPFFTEYTMNDSALQLTDTVSGVAYFLPSLMALFAFPFIRRLCGPELIEKTFTVFSLLLVVTLYLQAIAASPAMLMVARALYGVALVMTTASLDVRLFTFRQDESMHFNYGLAIAVQNLALLSAPLLAAALVTRLNLSGPFYFAMGMFVVGWLVGVRKLFARKAAPVQSDFVEPA